jgi:general secretion pathway protein J
MRNRRSQQGLTLLEVLIAAALLAMIATMIWAAFDQTAKMRTKLMDRQEHDHLARVALGRITRDLRAAFLSLHVNQEQRNAAVVTAFKAHSGLGGTQLDFASFTHRRLRAGMHEGDACEVGYKLTEHRSGDEDEPEVHGLDLVRRESPRIDNDPERGGVVDVLVPGIRSFDVRFYDEANDQWTETWDTTQATGQTGRLPLRARITLVIEEGYDRQERTYSTETPLFLTRPLTFGLPIY